MVAGLEPTEGRSGFVKVVKTTEPRVEEVRGGVKGGSERKWGNILIRSLGGKG